MSFDFTNAALSYHIIHAFGLETGGGSPLSAQNLEQQLDRIKDYVDAYATYPITLTAKRALRLKQSKRSPWDQFSLSFLFLLFRRRDAISGRWPKQYRELLNSYCDDDEKRSEYFRILTSDYRMTALCNSIMRKFPTFDFSRLAKLHQLKREHFRFKAWHYFGVTASLLLFLANLVPKTVAEQTFHRRYEDLQVRLFWIGLTVVGYLAALVLLTWIPNQLTNSRHAFFAKVLDYLAIFYDGKGVASTALPADE